MTRHSIKTIAKLKQQGDKITCLTAYDFSFAKIMDQANINMIMVGDSLGMVVQGHDTTLPVTLDEMVYHTQAVAQGVEQALIIGDLPFASYQLNREQAFASAARLLQAGAHVIKLEGGATMVDTINFLVSRGIPVCAHIGLTPQSVNQLGGYQVRGRNKDEAKQIITDASALQQAGASLIVLEAVPRQLAADISKALDIPTIGIGAGPDCDGQVLVSYDMLGIYPGHRPKFSKDFLELSGTISTAVELYIQEVRAGVFPASEHSF